MDPVLGEVPLTGAEPELLRLRDEMTARYGKSICMMWPGVGVPRPDRRPAPVTCRMFWHTISVDAAGRVSPCCSFPVSAFRDGLFETEDRGTPPLKGIAKPIRVHRVLQPSGVGDRLGSSN